MNPPLVSVIIPVYNGERYLAEALQSVFAQDYKLIEVIVVDDGSTDRTADIARAWYDIRYIYQYNQGHAAARNTGIEAAHGELLAFLDADDLWTPDKLRTQVGYLAEHPEVSYVICRQQLFYEDGETALDAADVSAGYVPSALLARVGAFEEVGRFDTAYTHSTDSDWFFRAKDAGLSMCALSQVLLLRRMHSSNLSRSAAVIQRELLKLVGASVNRQRGGAGTTGTQDGR